MTHHIPPTAQQIPNLRIQPIRPNQHKTSVHMPISEPRRDIPSGSTNQETLQLVPHTEGIISNQFRVTLPFEPPVSTSEIAFQAF